MNELEKYLDINVELFVGGTVLKVEALRQLKPYDIVKVEKSVSELIELRVSGKTIANGELVIDGDKFGVKIHHVFAR
ncbi:FliM/FliN family flagellar motor switch protein [Woodsholea maritima]|uniref:FliM/FliN family flagellar motor switch protein n=1 Tax=Woodsholea maritima TaxID=240237 RepID=UPI00036F2BD2|nr:FliM/FliN family flagellar motor switch protein [Woodsholea maritima]